MFAPSYVSEVLLRMQQTLSIESLAGHPLDALVNVGSLLQQPVGTTMVCRIEEMLPSKQSPLVTGVVIFTHTSRGMTVSGTGTAGVILTCMRCLEEYCEYLSFTIEEELHPEPGFADRRGADGFETLGEVRISRNHTLDLGEIIRQHIVLHVPFKPLCRTDCPGLEEMHPDG